MFVANELRKKNIAEYLLYMWQMEDTIRAFDCSLTRIRREYVERFDFTEGQKEEEIDWFGNLIRMMNQEGCREKGHLQINKVTLQMLIELHDQLLQSPKFPFYNTAYYKVLPFIVELRNRGANKEENDNTAYYKVLPFIVELRNRGANKEENEIETCFNSLYGVMLLRLQHKDISPETAHAVKEISTFIGMLSDYYHKDKTEGIEL